MSICASGISQPKPGNGGTIAVTPVYMGSITDFPTWVQPFLPYVSLVTVNIDTLCASDPPTVGSVPSADVFGGLLQGVFSPVQAAQLWIESLLQNAIWYQWCQCSAGAQPTLPTYPGPPTGLPVVNPPQLSPPTAVPCAQYAGTSSGFHGASDFRTEFPVQSAFNTIILGTLPSGFTSINLNMAVSTGTPTPGGAWTLNVSFFGAAGISNSLGGGTLTVATGASGSALIPTKPGAVYYYVWSAVNGSAGVLYPETLTLSAQLYCGGSAPGSVTAPCCPPDAFSTGMLQQILSLVTLQQRQTAPFAYLSSTVHAALTGAGSVAVSGILALKAALTALPSNVGQEAGTPLSLFGAGWINLGTSDGFEERVQLTSTAQLIVPRMGGIITTVGYSLPPGVTLTLTELIREP